MLVVRIGINLKKIVSLLAISPMIFAPPWIERTKSQSFPTQSLCETSYPMNTF